ncbi:Sulfur metabolite repression control protein, partial [Balamuthia mandrillaris]
MKESGADGAETQETSPPSTSSASSSGQDGERQGIAPKGATRPPTELPRSHSKEAKTTRSAAWKQEKEKEKEEEEEEAEDEDNSNFAEIEDKIHLFTLRILEAKLQPYKEWRFVGLKQRHKAYCQVWVGDEVHAKTAVAKNSLHPKWNSTFYFQLRSSELDSQDIGVLLWNKEAFLKDSLVGTVKLSVQHLLWKMQSLPEGEELVEWYPLSRRSDKFPKVGDIHLAISHESRLVVDFIATLSDELAQYIFSFLDAKTLCIIAGVSRQWKRLADDGRMWKHYFKKHKWNTGVAVVANGKTWKTSYATHRGTYATIGEAINAANPSTAAQSNGSGGSSSNNYSSSSGNGNNKEELELMDTLILAKGVYEESITINKPLRIVGDGNCEDVVIRAKSRSALSFRTEKGKVQNIKIEQVGTGKHSAIHINQGALVVKDCDISSDGLACIAVSNKATPIIRRNRIHDSTNIGVLVLDYGAGLYEDNDIFAHSHACVEVRNHSEPKFINNIIRDGNSTGVMAVNNGKGLFEGNDIRNNNRAGIKIKSGANPIFKLNEIHRGKQRGVCAHKDGLGYFESNNIHSNGRSGFNIRDGANPVLKRNQIHDGLSAGVLIHDGGKGLLKANSIYRNLLSAVEIRQGGDPILIKNRIYSGKSDGIYVHSSGKGSLENNDIFQNARAGVRIKSGARPILRRNRIYDGFAQGVDINTGGGHLEGNEIYGNALYGVQIRGGGSGEAGAGAEGNSGGNSTIMLQNKIYNNKHNGVLISGKGSILMERNDIYSNLVIGIEVLQDAAPVVRGNRVIGGQNQKIGFSLAMNTSGLLEDNSIYENLVCGLEISTAGNPIVRRNQIFNGKGTGVRILENGCALLEENEIFGNESCNVKIESSYLGEDDERVTLIRNRVYNGLSSGVDIKNGSNA